MHRTNFLVSDMVFLQVEHVKKDELRDMFLKSAAKTFLFLQKIVNVDVQSVIVDRHGLSFDILFAL